MVAEIVLRTVSRERPSVRLHFDGSVVTIEYCAARQQDHGVAAQSHPRGASTASFATGTPVL